jgi:hypothetical protein
MGKYKQWTSISNDYTVLEQNLLKYKNKKEGRKFVMKKFLVVLSVVLFVFGVVTVSASATQPEVKVVINGIAIDFPDAKPFIDTNGRTQVPVRFVTEAMKGTVDWERNARIVTVNRGRITALLTIGKNEISVLDVVRTMDTAPMIVQDRTYVPLRFISEALGADVRWSASEFTAYITDDQKDRYRVGDFAFEIEDGDNVSLTGAKMLNLRKKSGLGLFEDNTELFRAVCTLQILISENLDESKQKQQVEAILKQNISNRLTNEMMEYISAVKTRFDVLPTKEFVEGNYAIYAGGSDGAITFTIYMD